MKINNPQQPVREKVLPVLKDCLGENLKSVILYGSAASDSFNSLSSDINILILLERHNTASLAGLGKKWKCIIRKYRITPLVLTSEEFINSADVFPMEYNDISDRNIIIYGDNVLDKLDITGSNMRHQIEERLRGLSNQIRQLLLSCGGSKMRLMNNLKALPGILRTILRSALRLKGTKTDSTSDEMIISGIKKAYGVDFSICLPSSMCKCADPFDFTDSLLGCIDAITAQIDSMDRK